MLSQQSAVNTNKFVSGKYLQKVINHSKLTGWEWEGLVEGYNMADGHAHQGQSLEYLRIVKNLPQLYLRAEKGDQKKIQNSFEEAFFDLAGQKSYKKFPPPLYHYACSLSIEVVANYLRLTKKSIALLHPTFDNLADILKRHKLRLFALDEDRILEPEKNLKNLQADALFVVCPNNPTGLELSREQFIALVDYCKKYNKLLILDFSFRFYSTYTTWDQYKLLLESGIDFIILEDTGKTWPTLELKIGILLASNSVYPFLYDITNDFLLNVSPLIFTLLTNYIEVERKNKTYYETRRVVQKNRIQLGNVLKSLPLKVVNSNSKLSVEWVKLPNKWQSTLFCKWLSRQGVHVLPGAPFYWADKHRGESYIRIALQRPEKDFNEALVHLEKAILAYHPN